jgi:hypothetical protein
MNLEGKYRYIKQSLKPFDGVYNDWEIISLFHVFNKKRNIIKVNYFIFFYKLMRYFKNLINYYCNFFISTYVFYKELFYNIAYTYNEKIYNIKTFNFNKLNVIYSTVKFYNTLFFSSINNYYINDFYTKNSKTMSFSSLKKYKIFKL